MELDRITAETKRPPLCALRHAIMREWCGISVIPGYSSQKTGAVQSDFLSQFHDFCAGDCAGFPPCISPRKRQARARQPGLSISRTRVKVNRL